MQHGREFGPPHTLDAPALMVPPLVVGDPLPQVPVLLATQLELERMVQEPAIDLGAVSRAVLSDVGATIQIFRLIGEEYGGADDRPTRIDDCIASLEVAQWFGAISSMTPEEEGATADAWRRARQTAAFAREAASSMEDVSPEEAYVVGLLCDIGQLPSLLGWDTPMGRSNSSDELGGLLAEYWQLPRYVCEAIREQQQDKRGRWSSVLAAASGRVEQDLVAGVGRLA